MFVTATGVCIKGASWIRQYGCGTTNNVITPQPSLCELAVCQTCGKHPDICLQNVTPELSELTTRTRFNGNHFGSRENANPLAQQTIFGRIIASSSEPSIPRSPQGS